MAAKVIFVLIFILINKAKIMMTVTLTYNRDILSSQTLIKRVRFFNSEMSNRRFTIMQFIASKVLKMRKLYNNIN